MTKTYLIEKDWGRDVRVTVDHTVTPRVQYSDRPDSAVVLFEKRVGQYDTETVLLFANVTNFRLLDDDVVVEEKQIDYDEVAKERQEMVADPIERWVRV